MTDYALIIQQLCARHYILISSYTVVSLSIQNFVMTLHGKNIKLPIHLH